MPPKNAKAAVAGETADGRKQPTAQEAYLFYTIIKNMKGKPEVDWNAVAADAGFKNAETAKVRYGQIKRKLGLDNWHANATKGKDAKDGEAADNGNVVPSVPETPTPARSKKAAGSQPTSGANTGAGVKKRASTSKRANNTTTPSRSRKAKSQALVKLEETPVDDADLGDEDDEMMADLVSPTKIKTEQQLGLATGAGTGTGTGLDVFTTNNLEYANFPAVLPAEVIERQAILVNHNGTWTVTPVAIDVHAQWLARLPAHIQTCFYAQAQEAGGVAVKNKKNGRENGGEEEHAVQAQLLSEHFDAGMQGMHHHLPPVAGGIIPGMEHLGMDNLMGMGLTMGTMGSGYLPALNGLLGNNNGNNFANAGNIANNNSNGTTAARGTTGTGNNNNNAANDVDLHSVPLHPSYLAQLEQEARDREQEERDHRVLFGGAGAGAHGHGHGHGHNHEDIFRSI